MSSFLRGLFILLGFMLTFALLTFSVPSSFAAARTCAVLEDPHSQGQWTYCTEERPRHGDVTPCAGTDFGDGEVCVLVGRVGQPLIPATPMSKHDVDMIFGETSLSKIIKMKPGQSTGLISLEDESSPLKFVRAITPPEATIPLGLPAIQAHAKESSARVKGIPTVTQTNWLAGIPTNVQPLIKSWLAEESKVRGVNNLLDTVRRAHTPACAKYLDQAVRAFTAEGVPKLSVLSLIAESGCNLKARSKEGALGLCQFMPKTAEKYGLRVDPPFVDDRLDPEKCIPAAAKYSRANLDELAHDGCSGTLSMKSLMAYNLGMPNFQRDKACVASDRLVFGWRGEPGEYVKRILGMAFVLDANLNGTEIPSTTAPAARKRAKNKPKPTTMASSRWVIAPPDPPPADTPYSGSPH